MAVTIRRATLEDVPAIARMAIALSELHVHWDARRFSHIATVEGATRFYGDRSEADGAALLVADDGERVMGFAYLEYEPVLYSALAAKVAWLHDIYVEAEARGAGVGSSLLRSVRSYAAELGADKVLLSVAIQNGKGKGLFERNGFRPTMYEMMLDLDLDGLTSSLHET
jgi:GNAT superfamily N-acetyltransferase